MVLVVRYAREVFCQDNDQGVVQHCAADTVFLVNSATGGTALSSAEAQSKP